MDTVTATPYLMCEHVYSLSSTTRLPSFPTVSCSPRRRLGGSGWTSMPCGWTGTHLTVNGYQSLRISHHLLKTQAGPNNHTHTNIAAVIIIFI